MKITPTAVTTASQLTRGTFICLTATIIWSTTAIFIRYLTVNYGMPPLVLAFWRDAFVFLGLAFIFAVSTPKRFRLERRHLPFMILYGFILAIFNAIWTISVKLNGAAISTVLVFSSAIYTVFLGWQIFNEHIGVVKILGSLVALVGLILVSGAYDPTAWQLNAAGIIIGLISGITFSLYSLMGRACSYRLIDPWTTLFYIFGFAMVFLFIFNLAPGWITGGAGVSGLFWLGDAWIGWLILLLLSIGPTIGGYGLYAVSLTYLPASLANLIATFEPAMTAILAYFLLSERFSLLEILGGMLILGSVIALRLIEGRAIRRFAINQAVAD
ncbi:MAG: DMT family transporter [Anaerolineales bacterium]|nr:DMT family transporter [Anaerolineales bacterium]